MQLPEILSWLRECAPEQSALEGDPVGLQISPAARDIAKVVVCLDTYGPIVEAAADGGAQLIVCHHPLIYAPLKRLDEQGTISPVVMALVRAGIGLYAMHTNWDRAPHGVNETLADLLGLSDIAPLADQGVGVIARVGALPAPLGLDQLCAQIEAALECRRTSTLRYFPSRSGRPIQRIAVCGGAGGSLVADAVRAGADALVTSDVRHHEWLEAYGSDLALIDAGHAATEEPGMRSLTKLLAERFPALGVEFRGLSPSASRTRHLP